MSGKFFEHRREDTDVSSLSAVQWMTTMADLKGEEGTSGSEDFEQKRLNDQIEEVEEVIRSVERSIASVEEHIRDLMIKIKKEADDTKREKLEKEQDYLWEDKRQLREKERQLREKERQLREDKRQLREKELILLGQKPDLAAAISSHLLKDLRGPLTFGKDTVSISGVKLTAWNNLLESQRLTYKLLVERVAPSHSKSVEVFGWDDRQESAQADRYIPHLQKSVTTPRSVSWVNGNLNKDMLTVEASDLPFKLKGTTDVAICTKVSVKMLNPSMGLRVLFELKKEVKREAQFQALAALVAANILCPDLSPVIVLTDLKDVWQLFYINDSTVYGLSQGRADVIGLVEDILREGDDVRMEEVAVGAGDVRNPSLHQRKKLRTARALDREGDIANIGDLEGMLPPEEITHGRQFLLLQELWNIPAVRQLYNPDSFPENRSIPGMSQEPHTSPPPTTMYL